MANTLALGTSAIREQDGLYSLNDLHTAAGGEVRHQPTRFMRLDQTQALIAELANSPEVVSFKTAEGRNGGTYACRELAIAYAAWISAAFHLKVIRVFLIQLSSNPLQLPAAATHSVDVRSLLLDGQPAQPVAIPREVDQAINKKAWELAHDAYELLRQHMTQRMAYRHVKGSVNVHTPKTLDTRSALADIATLTLGQALTHTAQAELRYALDGIRIALHAAQDAQARVQQQIDRAQ